MRAAGAVRIPGHPARLRALLISAKEITPKVTQSVCEGRESIDLRPLLTRIFHEDAEVCLSEVFASQHEGLRATTPSRKETTESLRLCGFARLLHEICCHASG
jgi:hypothetical protein